MTTHVLLCSLVFLRDNKSPSSSYNSLLWFPIERVLAGIVKLVDLTEFSVMSSSQACSKVAVVMKSWLTWAWSLDMPNCFAEWGFMF